MPFGSLLEAFWTPFGRLLDAFWIPGRLSNFNQFQGPKNTRKIFFWEPHFDTILALLPSCWRSVFCCFFGCAIFSHVAVPGAIWGPIWDAFWSTWELSKLALNVEWKYDFHTLEILFAGMISSLDRVSVFL